MISAPVPLATPAPAPTPTPPAPSTPTSPTSAAFTPVAGKLFSQAPTPVDLAVAGEARQFEYRSDGSEGIKNLRELDVFAARYDAATDSYHVTVAAIMDGLLIQTSAPIQENYFGRLQYSGKIDPAQGAAPSEGSALPVTVLKSGRGGVEYSYLSLISWGSEHPAGENLRTVSNGLLGIAQATLPGDVPLTGSATYLGEVFGLVPNDSLVVVGGVAHFDFDFARATLAGAMSLDWCSWGGCARHTGYDFTDTRFARGATTFSARLSPAGSGSTGELSGIFAGAGGAELLARFEAPLLHYDTQLPTTVAGVILAKKN